MTSKGFIALQNYLTQVDGYFGAPECATAAYTDAFYYQQYDNCQPNNAAAVYGNCLCSKDGDNIKSHMTSDLITIQSCGNVEASAALSLYSGFCSSASVLAAQLLTSASSAATTTNANPGGTITSGPQPTSNFSNGSSTGGNISGGAIAGIVIGIIVLILIVIGGIWFIRWRRHRPRWPEDRTEVSGHDRVVLSDMRNNRTHGWIASQ